MATQGEAQGIPIRKERFAARHSVCKCGSILGQEPQSLGLTVPYLTTVLFTYCFLNTKATSLLGFRIERRLRVDRILSHPCGPCWTLRGQMNDD
jgi:hypothetical protein